MYKQHRGWRAHVARLVVVTIVAGASCVAVVASSPVPASAATPSILASAEAQANWGFLEARAEAQLAAHGLPVGASEQPVRPLVRSFIFTQLLALLHKSQTAPGDLSAQETQALDYLRERLKAERQATAVNVYARYWNFATTEQNCSPGQVPAYRDGSPGMGGFACVFKQMFGNTPSPAQFAAAGFAETMQAFTTDAGAAAFFDTAHSLSWWSSLNVVPSQSDEEQDILAEILEFLNNQLPAIAIETVQNLADALVSVAGGESAAAGFAAVAEALAGMIAIGLWNYANSQDVAGDLAQAVTDAETDVELSDIAGMVEGHGTPELLYVVIAETLPVGNALPASASETLSQEPVSGYAISNIGDFPCSWADDTRYLLFEEAYSGCFGYRFAADPDAFAQRYPAGSTPPNRTATDPVFDLTRAGTSTTIESPALQQPNAALVPWVSSDVNGNAFLHDASSARATASYSPSIHYPALPDGSNWPAYNAYTGNQGYASYVHDNMFVTQFPDSDASYAPRPATWQYNAGVRYVDWNGNWWIAWLQDGTFRHVKVAEPIGRVYQGNAVSSLGKGPCVENPYVPVPGQPGTYDVNDPDCLFANSNGVEKLQNGDAVLVSGQIRVVQALVDCIHFDQDNAALIAAGFGIAVTSDCGVGNGSSNYRKAVYLKPGVSTTWESLSLADALGGFLNLPSGSFQTLAADDRAMRLVRADVDNCDTSPFASESTTATCFVSPAIRYRAHFADGSTQNWNARIAYPPVVTAVPPTGYDTRPITATVATFESGDPNAVASNFTANVAWGDGTNSAGTVIATPDGFAVEATHTYATAGVKNMTVSVNNVLNWKSASDAAAVTVKALPRIVAAATRPPDANGWYNHSVDVQYTCSGSGNVCFPNQTFSVDGAELSSAVHTVDSPEGDVTSDPSNVVTIKLDSQAPEVTTGTVAVDATTPTGTNVDLMPAASDALSGVASVLCTPLSNSAFAIGDTATTCSATDVAGNVSGATDFTVHVRGASEQAQNFVTDANLVGFGTFAADAAAIKVQVDKPLTPAVKTAICSRLYTFTNKVISSWLSLPPELGGKLLTDVDHLSGVIGGCPFQAQTTTTVTINPTAPVTGQATAVTATVLAGGNPVLSGKVQFYADGAPLGKAAKVTNGVATATTTALGGRVLSATYLGSISAIASNSAPVTMPEVLADTTTTVTVAPKSPVAGYVYGAKALTLTAAVKAVAPGGGIPTGLVYFYDTAPLGGSTLLGISSLTLGKATLTSIPPLSAGTHFLGAVYMGPGPYNVSFSPANVVAVVNKAPTTTKVTAPNVTYPGDVSVTATVTAGGGSKVTPNGNVQFVIEGQGPIGAPVPLDEHGIATTALSGLDAGSRKIRADFLGSDNFAVSSRSVANQIAPMPSTVTLTATPNRVMPAAKVTMRATVTSPLGPVSGTVSFRDGTKQLAKVTLVDGVATAAVAMGTVGTHNLTAVYSGAPAPSNIGGGVSAVVPVLVPNALAASDNFADAAAVTGTSGSTSATNAGASAEPGEPSYYDDPGSTMWFRWQAPRAGTVVFDTCTNTSFDTVLAAYTGTALDNLDLIEGNDDDEYIETCGFGGRGSRVVFRATQGETYSIQVDGSDGDAGGFQLSWLMPTVPANDNLVKATSLNGKTSPLNGNVFGASAEAGEPDLAYDPGVFNSIWYKWKATTTGTAVIDTCANPHNIGTHVGVFTGTTVNALTNVAFNDFGCDRSDNARVVFKTVANTTYLIQVDTPYLTGDSADVVLSWAMVTPPTNDEIAGAIPLSGETGTITGDNSNATTEPGEPPTCVNCNDNELIDGPDQTVWYRWTAPLTKTVTFDTCGSGGLPGTMMLAVYFDSVGDGTRVANDRHSCGFDGGSRASFAAIAGFTYYIQVDGYNGVPGFALRWDYGRPANDAFADAIILNPYSDTRPGTTDNGSNEPGEPQPFPGTTKTVWYTWTAPDDTVVAFDTCVNTGFDTTLGVYTGTDVAFLNPVASNDNLCGVFGEGSTVTFNAIQGQRYYIQVSGRDDGEGTFTLNFAYSPENDQFLNRTVLTEDSGFLMGSTTGATIESGEAMAYTGPWNSVWYDWTPAQDGTATIDTCWWAGFDTQLSVWTGALGALELVARSNDEPGCGTWSRVQFTVQAGVSYRISVDGSSPSQRGEFGLTWSLD